MSNLLLVVGFSRAILPILRNIEGGFGLRKIEGLQTFS
jgi:hypothetical protein